MRWRRARRRYGPRPRAHLSPPRNPLALPHRNPTSTSARAPISRLDTEHRTSGEPPGARFGLRLGVAVLLVVALFAVLLVRLWSLQVVQGPLLAKLGKADTTRTVTIDPPRGDIVARGGEQLAGEVSREVVTLSRTAATNHPAVIGRLADLLHVSAASIRDAINSEQYSPYAPVPVATDVSSAAVVTISSNRTEFPGVTTTREYERTYPQDSLAAQTIGYLHPIDSAELKKYAKDGYQASDIVGSTGLEEEYEVPLRGTPGTEQLQVDPDGDVASQHTTKTPVGGDTLVLNMSLPLEKVLSNAIANEVTSLRGSGEAAPWAAGVVLGPDGAVLASDSYPSYDNNWWSTGGISTAHYKQLQSEAGYPLNDYAVAGLQPPGSTFKLATATAALDDGLITPYTPINDPGYFKIGNKTLYDTAESEGAGELNVTQAISESNDIFFYQLGAWFWFDQKKYGLDAIQNVAHEYGLGASTGVDLPDASLGQIDSPQLRAEQHREDPAAFPDNTYEPGDNVDMAFGQAETVITALQDAVAYSTFANGGTRYAPRFADALVSPSGKVDKIAPKVMDRIHYNAAGYDAMLAGFQGAVQDPSGTAYAAFQGFDFSNWNLYGKTGTATVSDNDVVAPTAWFVGFGGPKGGAPKYVVAIEFDKAGYGADAAAPVARQVFNYLHAHPLAGVDLAPAKN